MLLDGKDSSYTIATEMQRAHSRNEPIPPAVILTSEDSFVAGKIKHLIQNMTRYNTVDRIKLPMVKMELSSVKGNTNEK